MSITLDAETEAHVRDQARKAGYDNAEQFVRDRLLFNNDFDMPEDPQERAALEASWAHHDEIMATIRSRQADALENSIPHEEVFGRMKERLADRIAEIDARRNQQPHE